MAIKLRLDLGSRPAGAVVFRSLLLLKPDDCRCEPDGILTQEEIEALAGQLSHLPAIYSGVVGKYRWEEVAGAT